MAMGTVGLRTSLWNNNLKSLILLGLLSIVLGALVWTISFVITENYNDAYKGTAIGIGIIAVWFFIAYLFQERMTMSMAHAQVLDRKSYPEIYNLVENLSITAGIKMPTLYMMDTDALNAFASGIRVNDAAICVTRGLVEKLSKPELEAVLAHEMSHIIHRDMRLLTIATIFVGIIAIIAEASFRSLGRGSSSNKKNTAANLFIALAAAVGYFIAILSKLALSRRREFMADAGSVALTKDREAMISALKSISGHSELVDAPADLRFMLFDNTQSYMGLMNTHPSIEKRIEALEKY